MDTEKKPLNCERVILTFVYSVIAIAGFVCFWYYEMFSLVEPQGRSYQFDRYLWCLSSSLFGFSFIAFHHRRRQKSPFPEYIFYYPGLLLVISALVFSILHLSEVLSGFVFYYLSFTLCFILSFLVDSFWKLVPAILSNWVKSLTKS